jgi:hypothetical protein
MNSWQRFGGAFVLLATLCVGSFGCGSPSKPPEGAPSDATAPKIEQGQAETSAEAEAEQKAEPAAEPAPETKTAQADSAGDWGTLTGRIVFDGKAPAPKPIDTAKDPKCSVKLTTEDLIVGKDGGLQNAVVMLRSKPAKINPELEKSIPAEAVLDNKNCRFEPHVQVVLTKQKLLLKNSDPTGHNSNLTPLKNAAINPVLAAGGAPVEYKFSSEEALPVKVGCNIHPWMGAWIVARTDPYAAVTDENGNFEIKDLPAGSELEFRLWHENPGYLKDAAYKGGKADRRGTFKVKIKPGKNDLGDIKVSGSIFKK